MKTGKDSDLAGLMHYSQAELGYNEYLHVPDLLSLQRPLSKPAHHDEMLFIIIHQSYELWFKLIIHELETALHLLEKKEILGARHFLVRITEVLRALVPQIHILETMTPVDFLKFRGNLMPASGFQSVQFREIEFMAGMKDPRYLGFFKTRPEHQEQLQKRLDGPDLAMAYLNLLRELGFKVPKDISAKNLETNAADNAMVLRTLSEIYLHPEKNLPLYLLSETLMDLDEYLGLWRDHHVRVVERVIGYKQGTGGSSGASYLRQTLEKKAFPWLWAARTHLEMEKT